MDGFLDGFAPSSAASSSSEPPEGQGCSSESSSSSPDVKDASDSEAIVPAFRHRVLRIFRKYAM